jgi:hypothetical protein
MPMSFVRFIAEYEDGSKECFDIPRADLRTGDHVARIIAGERQRAQGTPPSWEGFAYQLKPGKIRCVYRDPRISYMR